MREERIGVESGDQSVESRDQGAGAGCRLVRLLIHLPVINDISSDRHAPEVLPDLTIFAFFLRC